VKTKADDKNTSQRSIPAATSNEYDRVHQDTKTSTVLSSSLKNRNDNGTELTVKSALKSPTYNISFESVEEESTPIVEAINRKRTSHSMNSIDVRHVRNVESSEKQGKSPMEKVSNRTLVVASDNNDAVNVKIVDKLASNIKSDSRGTDLLQGRTSSQEVQKNGLPPAPPKRPKRKAPLCPTGKFKYTPRYFLRIRHTGNQF